MPAASADKNLVIGIVALRLGLIDVDSWKSANARSPSSPATDLLETGRISAQGLAAAESIAASMLAGVSGDRARCLELLGADAEEEIRRLQDRFDPNATVDFASRADSIQPELSRDGDEVADSEDRRAGDSSKPIETVPPSSNGAGLSDGRAPGNAGGIDARGKSRSVETAPRFQPISRLAEGGLGELYVARDSELPREVALKEIKRRYSDNESSRSRFNFEAEVTGGLEHPGIVPIYARGHHPDGRPYYAMRLIRGVSLKDAIDGLHEKVRTSTDLREIRLDFRKLLRRFVSVCEALEYAHSRNFIHRDLKPENVMLGPFGETLVVDWGLAKQLGGSSESTLTPASEHPPVVIESDEERTRTRVGSAIGTPAYMPPEQAMGRPELIGKSSDVFGLGTILYYLLTGRPPYRAASHGETMEMVRACRFTPPRKLVSIVPPPVEAICLKAMQLYPKSRYPSAKAMIADLERWFSDEPVSVHPESPAEYVARWARRHRTLVTVGGFALIAVSIVSVAAVMLIENARRDEERSKTEANTRYVQAREAVDTLLTAVSKDLRNVPAAQRVRKQLLEKAAAAYQDFLKARSEDRSLGENTARAFVGLGEVRMDLNDLSGAAAAFDSARLGFRDLASKNPDRPEYQIGHADTYIKLGIAAGQAYPSEPDRAMPRFKVAIEILSGLSKRLPEDRRVIDRMSAARVNIANAFAAGKNYEQAELAYLEASESLRKLVALNPKDADARDRLASATTSLVETMLDLDRPVEKSTALAESSVATYRELLREYPDKPDYQQGLVNSLMNLGNVFKHANVQNKAESTYLAAIREGKVLVDQNPSIPIYHELLGNTYYNLGLLLNEQADKARTEIALRSAIEHIDKDWGVEGARLEQDRRNLIPAYEIRIPILIDSKRDREAIEAVEKYLAIPLTSRKSERDYNGACYYSKVSSLVSAPQASELRNRAAELLERAVEDGLENPSLLATDPDLDAARSHPKIQALIKKLPPKQSSEETK